MTIHCSRTAIAVALSFAFQPVFATTPADEAAVVVTATRIPTRVSEQLADVTVIDRAQIEAAGATTLPQLLAQQPGVQIVHNGGLGKATSVFMRGTNAGHTLLLVDGIPLGSATLGQPSLTNLPLAQIERIEILRGPASSLYGSDAIGGVIQIFTKTGSGPARPEVFVGAGSYSTTQLVAGIAGGSETISYSLRAARLETDGFNVASDPARFQQTTFALPNPDRDGYRNTSWNGRLAVRPAKGHELGATFLTADSRSQFDGGGPAVNAFNDDATRAWTLYTKNRLTQAWTSTLRYGESEDRSESFSPNRSLHATMQKQWSWQNDVKLPVGTGLLAYEDLTQNVDSTTNYTVKERNVRSLILGYQGRIGAHGWQLSQRHDDHSQFGGKTTGSVAYGYRFHPEWQARAAYGTAFKAPSFNQLYWPNAGFGGGNPLLLPETAKNREIGLDWQQGGTRVAWTNYDNRIRNLIAGWPPVNVGRARITGDSLEFAHASGAWSASASLDFLKPVNADNGFRLPRRAAQLGKAALTYAPEPWAVGAELAAVGPRYDTAIQARPLARYELVNLFGRYRLNRDMTLEGRIDNLFDKVYENAWGFANPRASVFLGLRYAPK